MENCLEFLKYINLLYFKLRYCIQLLTLQSFKIELNYNKFLELVFQHPFYLHSLIYKFWLTLVYLSCIILGLSYCHPLDRYDHQPDDDHTDTITGLTSCQRMKLYASSSLDGTIRIWDETNNLIRYKETGL